MAIQFFSSGIIGPRCGQTGWCLDDYIEVDRMVTDFTIHRVAEFPGNGRICHRAVLAACETNDESARLVCISLEAWPKILGHFNRDDQRKNPKLGVEKLFSAVFTGRHPYQLRTWFRAPYNLDKFDLQAVPLGLSFFTRYFE